MITEKEVQAVELSPTKKDFYQIWNELLDTASKISERWDPASTNESDPGIVLLKVLTAIADKLNYNIDKNTLEAFMPSASQQESMRKLCEMMGYDMKYYRSATTDVVVTYVGATQLTNNDIVTIGQFTNIKNQEDDINYVTTQTQTLGGSMNSASIPCIEGELVAVETDTDNIISLMLLDDNQRYYLPEAQIAENGIFIYNVNDGVLYSKNWDKVDNLNTQPEGSKVYKFGYDSKKGVPYVQFPDDISSIIGDGLIIYYIRTHGINGNISPRTLSVLTKPENWAAEIEAGTITEDVEAIYNEDPTTNFIVTNQAAVTNGANIETIDQAYNNYKKTIGTFDTLVTCRDYMNKIYQLTADEGDNTNTTPLVSNCIVSDIRDDINKSITLCSFNEYGITYSTQSLMSGSTKLINNFDLVLYPFRTYYNLGTKSDYEKSFTFDPTVLEQIKNDLSIARYKTISHNFVAPDLHDIVLIKNYLQLKAKITTTRRVTALEEKDILNSIYSAVYNRFNMRQLDFGEEIPFDDILECISNADIRIKNIALEEPILYTKFRDRDGNEYDTAQAAGQILYNKLALRNVLAGKISLFDYDDDFAANYTEIEIDNTEGGTYEDYADQYPIPADPSNPEPQSYPITSISGTLTITGEDPEHPSQQDQFKDYTLSANEVIQFRAPNFKTLLTYPAYVNYYLILNDTTGGVPAAPATMMTLETFMNLGSNWVSFISDAGTSRASSFTIEAGQDRDQVFNSYMTKYSQLFYNTSSDPDVITLALANAPVTNVDKYYYYELNANNYATWYTFICNQNGEDGNRLKGLFRRLSADMSRPIGELVDADHFKYELATQYIQYTNPVLQNYFVQATHTTDDPNNNWTANGLGRNANYVCIPKNTDYKLDKNEYLYINYSTTTSTDAGDETTVINKVYKENDIVRPNFDLVDSNKYAETHTYSKTTGFDTSLFKLVSSGTQTTEAIPGMFTFGANEQVEIREKAIIQLDNKFTKLYWERNDEKPDSHGIIKFTVDANNEYTLKPGEIFAYTDINQIDMAYYGSGSTIKLGSQTPTILKYSTDAAVSTDDIANYGLAANIPWRTYDLSGNDKAITILEHQYINLTEGDTLKTLNHSEYISGTLNNNWLQANSATYTYSGSDAIHELPAIEVDGEDKWFVKTILELDVGPDTEQTLVKTDNVEEKITLTFKNQLPSANVELISDASADPITFKTNYLIMSSADTVDTTTSLTAEEDEEVTDFKVKLFALDDTYVPDNLNNFSKEYTKISFAEDFPDEAHGQDHYKFNVRIPESKPGLVMLYYVCNAEDPTDPKTFAYITGENTSTHEDYEFTIYNNNNSWWGASYISTTTSGPTVGSALNEGDIAADGVNYYTREPNTNHIPVGCLVAADYIYTYYATGTGDGETGFVADEDDKYFPITDPGSDAGYFLRPGINIVELDNNISSFNIYPGKDHFVDNVRKAGDTDAIVVVGGLSIINGINQKLDYKKTNDLLSNNLEQALSDIAEIDTEHNFYYNCPIDNGNIIDLNENDDEELLSSPLTWYNYNNENNKFVISEIDTDAMIKGITLTSSSRIK